MLEPDVISRIRHIFLQPRPHVSIMQAEGENPYPQMTQMNADGRRFYLRTSASYADRRLFVSSRKPSLT